MCRLLVANRQRIMISVWYAVTATASFTLLTVTRTSSPHHCGIGALKVNDALTGQYVTKVNDALSSKSKRCAVGSHLVNTNSKPSKVLATNCYSMTIG